MPAQVKELEHSLKQYKSLKSYNEIIAQNEFQAKLMEAETEKETVIKSLNEEIAKLKCENEALSKKAVNEVSNQDQK